jgi:hypothetical protein
MWFGDVVKNLKGPHRDFDPEWYSNVGAKFVQTMIINSILPYVALTKSYVMKKLFRWLDHGNDVYKTKKTTMSKFTAMYE